MASQERVRRLVRLIDLLASGRAHDADGLAERCEVSRRTVFRDLNTLKDAGLAVRYDDDRRGFLLDRPAPLRPTDFTPAEALALLVLCDGIADGGPGGGAGVPLQAAARSATAKLLATLPPRLRESVGELSERVDVRLGPVNPLPAARPTFDLFVQALDQRRSVRVRYESYTDGRELATLVSPYRLLFHIRAWYVVGRSSVHRAVRTFNLGRVRHAELIDARYEIPPRFSLERHLGDAWSLIRDPADRHEVVVRFAPLVARNVAEVRWHRSQRLAWNDDGSLDFTVTVDGLREIVWWVLGYGKEAEVLRPDKLRSMLRTHADALCDRYADAPPA